MSGMYLCLQIGRFWIFSWVRGTFTSRELLTSKIPEPPDNNTVSTVHHLGHNLLLGLIHQRWLWEALLPNIRIQGARLFCILEKVDSASTFHCTVTAFCLLFWKTPVVHIVIQKLRELKFVPQCRTHTWPCCPVPCWSTNVPPPLSPIHLHSHCSSLTAPEHAWASWSTKRDPYFFIF